MKRTINSPNQSKQISWRKESPSSIQELKGSQEIQHPWNPPKICSILSNSPITTTIIKATIIRIDSSPMMMHFSLPPPHLNLMMRTSWWMSLIINIHHSSNSLKPEEHFKSQQWFHKRISRPRARCFRSRLSQTKGTITKTLHKYNSRAAKSTAPRPSITSSSIINPVLAKARIMWFKINSFPNKGPLWSSSQPQSKSKTKLRHTNLTLLWMLPPPKDREAITLRSRMTHS